MEVVVTGHNFESILPKVPAIVCFKLADWPQRRRLLSPLKAAILDGGQGHHTILKIDHLKTIHAMFALN
jgi:hypothetical protein